MNSLGKAGEANQNHKIFQDYSGSFIGEFILTKINEGREINHALLLRHNEVPGFSLSIAVRGVHTSTNKDMDLFLVNRDPPHIGILEGKALPKPETVGQLLGYFAEIKQMEPELILEKISRACTQHRMNAIGVHSLVDLFKLQAPGMSPEQLLDCLQSALRNQDFSLFLATLAREEKKLEKKLYELRPLLDLMKGIKIPIQIIMIHPDRLEIWS